MKSNKLVLNEIRNVIKGKVISQLKNEVLNESIKDLVSNENPSNLEEYVKEYGKNMNVPSNVDSSFVIKGFYPLLKVNLFAKKYDAPEKAQNDKVINFKIKLTYKTGNEKLINEFYNTEFKKLIKFQDYDNSLTIDTESVKKIEGLFFGNMIIDVFYPTAHITPQRFDTSKLVNAKVQNM